MKEEQLNFFSSENKGGWGKKTIIQLSADTFALISIIVVLLFVLSFSLGVERGRKQGQAAINSVGANVVKVNTEQLPVRRDSSEIAQPITSPVIEQPMPVTVINNPITMASNDDIGRYIIQVASCREKQLANKEVQKLEKNGYPVSLSKKGKFLVVFVGEFKNKNDAERNLETLKTTYKDCFIRRL